MNVKYMYSLLAVIALFLIAWIGSAIGLKPLFGIVFPYVAVMVFIAGFAYRVMSWARSSVPFAIPTTCGQQKSLPWIKPNSVDNPTSTGGVVLRMILEVVFLRSLFRNTRMKLKESGNKLAYNLEIFLWVGALAFHWAFFTVLFRHLRLFTNPVPGCVELVEKIDSFFRFEVLYDAVKVALPGVYLSGIILLLAVTYLLLRRLFIPTVKYISQAADYFPLFLIFGIAFTGILMRYFLKVDMTSTKELTMGLVTFHPTIPKGVGSLFFIHLFLVCVLLAYFPFSKLMHLGGVFLSPTRNMRTDTRARRHVNPWNYPVPIHTYEEYEDEFRDKMIEAGLPVEKMPEPQPAEETDKKESHDG